MIRKKRSPSGYWFTIQSPNGQTLATSETYTTAAMRDKGIEAVKKVVVDIFCKEVLAKADKKRDTFHLENKKGKIVKR